MATDHTEEFRSVLAAAGYNNVVAGDRWPSADEAMLVLPAPGGPRQRYLDGGSVEDKQDGVQVLVRGPANEFGDTKRRAYAAYDALRFSETSNYTYWMPLGGPGFIGRDEDERPQFSINFIARIDE